jgi:hypothetical protein
VPGEFRFVVFVVEDLFAAESGGEDVGDLLHEGAFLAGEGEGDAEAVGAHGLGELVVKCLARRLDLVAVMDSTPSGLGAFFWMTQGSREDAATLGWMMEYLRHSQMALRGWAG